MIRWWHQRELLEKYTDLFFDNVRAVFKERTKEFSGAFMASLFPENPEDSHILEKTEKIIKELTNDEKVVKRYLEEHVDDLNRMRNARLFCSK